MFRRARMGQRPLHSRNCELGASTVRVKMLVTRSRAESTRDLSYSLVLVFGAACVGYVGDWAAFTPVSVESLLKYHSGRSEFLTSVRDPDQGQCLMGSLTGAVAS